MTDMLPEQALSAPATSALPQEISTPETATAVATRAARSIDDRFRCKRNRRWRADRPAAVPQPPSFGQHGCADIVEWVPSANTNNAKAIARRCVFRCRSLGLLLVVFLDLFDRNLL